MGHLGYPPERARELRVPQPLIAAAPFAAGGLLVLSLATLHVVTGAVAFVAAAGCLLLAALRAARALRDRAALRRTADELIRSGVRIHPQSTLLVWRAAELTSDRNRKVLSRSLSAIARELARQPLVSPVPLDRRAVRPHVTSVGALAARVGRLECPVSPRGILLVDELLTDGFASPLYIGGRREDVPAALERCLCALDDRRLPTGSAAAWTDDARDGIDVNSSTGVASGGRR